MILFNLSINNQYKPDNHAVAAVFKNDDIYFFDSNGEVKYNYSKHIRDILEENFS
jgi:S-adenosylhomocysteine hydrolase